MAAPPDVTPPRWLRFAPFLGRPPALTARQWQVLGLVSIATLFDQYDRAARAAGLMEGPALARAYPARFAAVAAVAFVFSAGGAAADFMGPKYLQDAHGWAPAQVAVLYVLGGGLAIAGSAYAGRLSDRVGRRPVTVAFGVAVLTLAIAFYNASGWLLSPLWIVLIFTVVGHDVLLASFGAELFPTSSRSTAAGARAIVATLGGALGLALESLLYRWLGSPWEAISVMLCGALLGPLLVALAFPETAGRTLEEIAPEAR